MTQCLALHRLIASCLGHHRVPRISESVCSWKWWELLAEESVLSCSGVEE